MQLFYTLITCALKLCRCILYCLNNVHVLRLVPFYVHPNLQSLVGSHDGFLELYLWVGEPSSLLHHKKFIVFYLFFLCILLSHRGIRKLNDLLLTVFFPFMCVSLIVCVLVSLQRGAIGWSVICDCNNSLPYSLVCYCCWFRRCCLFACINLLFLWGLGLFVCFCCCLKQQNLGQNLASKMYYVFCHHPYHHPRPIYLHHIHRCLPYFNCIFC